MYPRDDCGLWVSASKIIVYKIREDNLVKQPPSAYKFDLNEKCLYDLQTNEAVTDMNSFVVIKKLYGTLKTNKSYQRRLTYFLEVPILLSEMRAYCYVEYGKIYPQ